MEEELNTSSFPEKEIVQDADVSSVEESALLSLPLGNELTCQETYSISATELTSFVVFVGATGCGKTTLVTSIYQQFLQEDFSEKYLFSGSRTLQSFEQRAYYTRSISEQVYAGMQRTPRGSLDSILHLRIWDEQNCVHRNLLLTDFSGEDYESVSGNILAAKEDFNVICAAKFIITILDGEKIAADKYKQAEVQKAIHILHTFNDAGLLHPNAEIIIAISKYDLVFNKHDDALNSFILKIPQKICNQIPALKSRLVLKYIAAMPDDASEIDTGYGINELFGFLMTSHQQKPNAQISTSLITSEFNLFGERALV